jgi:hypothetical protein
VDDPHAVHVIQAFGDVYELASGVSHLPVMHTIDLPKGCDPSPDFARCTSSRCRTASMG